jgi:hypothetical protein
VLKTSRRQSTRPLVGRQRSRNRCILGKWLPLVGNRTRLPAMSDKAMDTRASTAAHKCALPTNHCFRWTPSYGNNPDGWCKGLLSTAIGKRCASSQDLGVLFDCRGPEDCGSPDLNPAFHRIDEKLLRGPATSARDRPFVSWYQFSDGFSAPSMTMISTGPLLDSILSPSCS